MRWNLNEWSFSFFLYQGGGKSFSTSLYLLLSTSSSSGKFFHRWYLNAPSLLTFLRCNVKGSRKKKSTVLQVGAFLSKDVFKTSINHPASKYHLNNEIQSLWMKSNPRWHFSSSLKRSNGTFDELLFSQASFPVLSGTIRVTHSFPVRLGPFMIKLSPKYTYLS